MLNDQMNDFGAAPGKGTIALMMLGLGVGIGYGFYRTFSPAEQRRRLNVSDARDHARKVAAVCRKRVTKAREDVARVQRGEPVELVSIPAVDSGSVMDYDLDTIR